MLETRGVRVLVVVLVGNRRAVTPEYTLRACSEFCLFETHQFGDEADVGRDPFPSLRNMRIGPFQRPVVARCGRMVPTESRFVG